MSKWRVFRFTRGVWVAAQRGMGMDWPARHGFFPTHTEALEYANAQSLADQMFGRSEVCS